MELAELKQAWDAVNTPVRSEDDLRSMLAENSHPVLKKIRRQLTIETTTWSVFLAAYYSMFDGDRKPVWINVILIISVLLPLIHNLMGYRLARYLVNGETIRESLKNYLAKVKGYAAVAIACRVFFIVGLLVFFTHGSGSNTKNHLSFALIILIFLIQLALLYRLWAKRLKQLQHAVFLFSRQDQRSPKV